MSGAFCYAPSRAYEDGRERKPANAFPVIVPRMLEMTFPRCYVLRYVNRLVGAALLAGALAPTGAAQSKVPRFERGDCLLNGDWARDVRRECGWLVVPESAIGPTRRRFASRWRFFGPASRMARRRSSCCMADRVVPADPAASAGVAMSPWPKHRDVVIYDQRGPDSRNRLCAPRTTALPIGVQPSRWR